MHNLYGQAAPSSRGNIRLAMIALAVMWAYDLNLYTIAYFDPGSARGLFDWRGLVMVIAAPLFAIGGGRRRSLAHPAVACGDLPEPVDAGHLPLISR